MLQLVVRSKREDKLKHVEHLNSSTQPVSLRFTTQDWPLEKVKTEAERLFQLAQEAYVRSTLPPEPDRPHAERLSMEMISEYHQASYR